MMYKALIILGLIGIITFCGWLFWWPLLELFYGYISFDILVNDQFKLGSFIIGGIIFWICLFLLIKKGIKFII